MITIKKSTQADTRTCDYTEVTADELLKNTKRHISDVRKGMLFLSDKLCKASLSHDLTKIDQFDMFYRDFKTGFDIKEWWVLHQEKERHHLKDPQYVQDDVNLLDVLEMIVDGVMAGLARSGSYREEPIPDSLLRKAFNNTIALLLENVVLSSLDSK